jgi:hypothetical protein
MAEEHPAPDVVPATKADDAASITSAAESKAVLSPIEPKSPIGSSDPDFTPLVTVVGFHHARGPEVESWFGVEEGVDPAATNGWTLLPFMALSDGAHACVFLLLPQPDKSPWPPVS